jgi:hypothetical protein
MKFPCPTCGNTTRAVKAVTLRALLTEAALEQVHEFDGFRFCSTPECAVVYVQPETANTLPEEAVRVAVFQKSAAPTRLVCYCFDHSVNEITTEVAQTGGSTLPERITARCRNGEDHCEERNPQGSCCLGNVRAVLRAAKGDLPNSSASSKAEPPCCGSTCETPPSSREDDRE